MKNKIRTIRQENISILIIIIFYVCACMLCDLSLSKSNYFKVRIEYKFLYYMFLGCAIIFLIYKALTRHLNEYLKLNMVTGYVVILLFASPFLSSFASFKQAIPYVRNFRWDNALMRADYALHFGNHPWRLLQPILYHPGIIRVIDQLYMAWFLLLVFFSVWMSWSVKRDVRLQFFISAVLIWIGLGTIMAAVFYSAGPCYYHFVAGGTNPYQELMQKLGEINQSIPLWAIRNQSGLWKAYQHKEWLPLGGISAMPSLHVAFATLFCLVAVHYSKVLGVIYGVYLLAIQVGSVVLGWHYAVDGYVAIVATCVIWKAAGKVVLKHYLKENGSALAPSKGHWPSGSGFWARNDATRAINDKLVSVREDIYRR